MTIAYVGIDHVQLASPQGTESISRRFYGELLGMQEIEKPMSLQNRGGVWFQCGKHQLHIGIQDDFVPAKKAHPAFHITNVEALAEQLSVNDVVVQFDEAIEGAKRFYVFDPFGNRLEFIEWLS